MKGKFDSMKDEVIYRKAMDFVDNEIGTVDDIGWHGRINDLFGYDWIIVENSVGFVTVLRFDHIDIDDTGYFCPANRAWGLIEDQYSIFDDIDDDIDD